MVIKTLQGGFLGYCLSSLVALVYATSLSDQIISGLILATLCLFVAFNFKFLYQKSPKYLELESVKSRVGSLYSELNIWNKIALLQSTIFYVYRIFAALLLVGLLPFSVQLNGLITMTLVELCYLHVVKPYNVKYSIHRV